MTTWNMQGRTPKKSDITGLLNFGNVQHDIYVLGSQEAVAGIFDSMFKPSKQIIIDLCR
jgi:hypothetical protein